MQSEAVAVEQPPFVGQEQPIQAPQIISSSVVHPGELLRMAMSTGRDLAFIDRLMDLQERWEAQQARKAFNIAMAKFHEQRVKVTRSAVVKQGPMNGTPYAKLSDFVGAVAEPLAAAGLSISWRLVVQEKDWLEVACVVRHVQGHEEVTRMSGPPDQSGAKNAIQARASTVSYLEKYTLKMALGLAEQDDDDDGQGGAGGDQGGAQGSNRRDPEPPPPPPPPAEKPAMPAEQFDRNFVEWKSLIEGGREPERIIAKVETKYTLTKEQKDKIAAVKGDSK